MDCIDLPCGADTSYISTCSQSTTDSSFRDWEGLPPELLDIIVTKLGRLLDYIRFCSVCSQWRSVALRSDVRHKKSFILLKASSKKMPMLIMKTDERNDDTREAYSNFDGMTYTINLPKPCKNRIFGSSHGWLMSFEESKAVTLLNPLSDSCIFLPVFNDPADPWDMYHPGYYLIKGILSADPLVSPDNYMVVITYGGLSKLAFYKTGDLHWKLLNIQPQWGFCFSDVAFYNNSLYGVTVSRQLLQIDTDSLSRSTIIPADERSPADETWPADETCVADFSYLVVSQGELLLVDRFWLSKEVMYNDDDDRNLFYTETTSFKVFKPVHEKESAKWVQISNIGEQALFVGDNHCLDVSTKNLPECRPNHIYYNSQYHLFIPPYTCIGPDEDSGFFNLEDESIHFHHRLDLCERYMEPPIWFVPNPGFSSLD